jgi:hypothetical protein
LVSDVNGGFHLTPIGGLDATTYLDANQVWHNSYANLVEIRPQRQGKIDASTFFNTGNVSNELKFGGGYRHVVSNSLSEWAGAGYIVDGSLFGGAFPAGDNYFAASRASVHDVYNDYTSGYVQDTLTSGALTVNAGVRYDHQTGGAYAITTPANPVVPNLLPAFTLPGGPSPVVWNTFTPRLGATYALGKDRATLIRASYSRFADQLPANVANFLQPGYQSYYYFLTHGTGPGNPAVIPGSGMGYSGNVNPATGIPFPNNAIAPNLSAPITDEALLSVEHAFLPELVGNVNLTYRRLSNLIDDDLLVFDCSGSGTGCVGDDNSVGRMATQADYQPVSVLTTLPDGTVRDVTFYTLRPGIFTRNGTSGGGLIEVNGDRTQTYEAASIGLTKRLSNRWMLRGNFTVDSWKWHNTGDLPDQTEGPAGGAQDGDIVMTASGNNSGPKAYVYIAAKWTGSLNGLYQVMPDKPWGFNLAGNFTARQGYPLPYFIQEPININNNYPGQPREAVLAEPSPDSVRLNSLYDFDARIEKEFNFQDWGLTLGVDCFNLFNSSTVLQRVANLGPGSSSPGTAGYVYEILSPRIFRFGARINFR